MAVASISAALSSVKTLYDLTKAMVSRRDIAAFEGKMIEFQAKILDTQADLLAAQEERSSFLTRISDLEKEVADLKTWETEKQRYELKDFDWGVFAYRLKPEAQGSEPAHLLCANCFQHGRKSILQGTAVVSMARRIHACPVCNLQIPMTGNALRAATLPTAEQT